MAVGDSVGNPNIVENIASRLTPGDQMVLRGSAPIIWEDDFLGTGLDAYVVTTHPDGKWLVRSTGTPTTEAIVASAAGGQYTTALAATDEAEACGIYGADIRNFTLGKFIFNARVKISVLPTMPAAKPVSIVIGMQNEAIGDDPDSITASCWFKFKANGVAGNGLIYCETDDATADSGLVSTGLTVAATEWVWLTIDTTNIEDIKFYVNGVRVCTSTTFDMGGAAGAGPADLQFQPLVLAWKLATSSEGVGSIITDYVGIFSNR